MFGSRKLAAIAVFSLMPPWAAQAVEGQVSGSDVAAIEFGRQIRPIFADNCFACHGPDESNREGGLRLDQREGAFAEADSGSRPIVPGDVEASEIYARLITQDSDLRMPPVDSNKSLRPDQIELVRQWIEQGAPWQEHWSFALPRQDAIPNVQDKTWPKTPVDSFVLSRLEPAGLSPSPPADRRILLRRVTLDLTGLPPTIEEMNDFLADDAPEAMERVVDRLLQSERYGEHMARFWLDAVRYGDTHGLHLDNYREMWPYRDWVVRAFNTNMPFNQFVIKQLAGDLLPEATTEDLIATGFNRCHVTTNEGGSINEEVYVRNVVDRVTTTGTVFLGLTLECTRCHDHKYDPLTMRDFYAMFAFFNSLDGNAMDGNAARHEPIVKLPTAEQEQRMRELSEQISDVKSQITSAVAAMRQDPSLVGGVGQDADRHGADAEAGGSGALGGQAAEPPAGKRGGPSDGAGGLFETLAAWIEAQHGEDPRGLPDPIWRAIKAGATGRTEDQLDQLRDYFVEHACTSTRATFEPLHERLASLQKERDEIDSQVASTLVFKELMEPRPSFVLHRGEYDQRRDEVARATPAVLPPMSVDAPRNRLGLAHWLVDGQHPLTARVTVNRLWQQVFGTGLVKTSEDFGSQGEAPSHPALLDWLAVQFVEDGWDVKAMMKRLVLSATYQQSSKVTPESAERDPANRLLSRGPRFRLDAEMLRDQALAVSGLLVNQLGGPSVKPPQPDGLWHAVGYSGSNTVRFKADEGNAKIHRRTLYTFIKRTAPPPQMSTLDAPSRELCTVRRERTNTPLQALLLMNDPQYVEAARALARRVMAETSSCQDRIDLMFQRCAARHPTPREATELREVVGDLWEQYREGTTAANLLADADQGDHDAGGESSASELAAWTVVANLMLNLDEVITKN
jgi:mono/diheme cytochrome c family protein